MESVNIYGLIREHLPPSGELDPSEVRIEARTRPDGIRIVTVPGIRTDEEVGRIADSMAANETRIFRRL